MPDAPSPDSAPAAPDAPEAASDGEGSRAVVVAGGILASRIVGLVRVRALAHFFGVGAFMDVVETAFRLPNLIQNLLGEGTISAAFVPVYSRMLSEGRPEAAGRFAGAVLGLVLATAAGLALAGVLLAEPIVAALAYGFTDDAARVATGALAVDRYALAVRAVRIVFPMTALLALAAWALGILNSHRRFFVPYVAPVAWNVAIIGALVGGAAAWAGDPWGATLPADTLARLVVAACVGGVVGGALQFLVQLPFVLREVRGLRLAFSLDVEGVREAVRAFGPMVAGRGVVQLSSLLDLLLASLLAAGAVGALRFALLLYTLPISLFGLSVAAAELPELARLSADALAAFLARVRRSLRQVAFLTIPTVVGYLAFGLLLVGALLRTGRFGAGDAWLVYLILAAYALGLLATTMARLLQNAFYALGDTATPARLAALRVGVSTAVAVPTMLALDGVGVARVTTALGLGAPAGPALMLGAVGLALGASVGAWVEWALLRRALRTQTDAALVPWGALAAMTGLAAAAALPAAALWAALPAAWPPLAAAPLVTGAFATAYLGAAFALDRPELRAWLGRLGR